jgi:hypothetical protein
VYKKRGHLSPHYLDFINNGANIGIFLKSAATFFIESKNQRFTAPQKGNVTRSIDDY